MTRFARAKGSKASNERREEDATPWHVMRQQLANKLDNNDLKDNEDLSQIVKNINNSQLENTNEIWSDFGDTNNTSVGNKKRSTNKNKESKKSYINSDVTVDSHGIEQDSKNVVPQEVKGKVPKIKNMSLSLNCTTKIESQGIKKFSKLNSSTEKGVYKNIKTSKTSNEINPVPNRSSLDSITDNGVNQNEVKKNTAFKGRVPKIKNKSSSLNCTTKIESQGIKKSSKLNSSTEKGVYKNIKTSKTSNEINPVPNRSSLDSITDNGVNQNEVKKNTAFKGQNKKIVANKNNNWAGSQWYNKYNNNPYTILANGREIEIVRYDGFLVKKDDADQLRNLRRKLKSKNIAADKIKAIMKLERRKAEKALAREKNTVCFQCRKFGHNFANCPDIKDSEASKSGICFKCGSTEHTYFQCKVSQNQNFRYAVCFVCNEQGHIAKQCTLNPQGQYPKGGSCHLCGEVTHLRKDCPKAVEEKSSKAANSSKNNWLEDIDEVGATKKSDKIKKKIVKF